MPFIGRILLEPVKEAGFFSRGLWAVTEDLIFRSERHPNVLIAVPKGTVTDLASVPRWLPISWALTGGTNVKAGVVHDWIYHHPVYVGEERKMLPRWMCDDIFDEIGELEKTPDWRRNLMWSGIRLGGWASYGEVEA